MKRCPECRRDYYDDSLFYCLDDGASLLEGPASAGNGARTEILQVSGLHEPPTVAFHSPTSSEIRRLSSVAVLPFANLSGEPANEYFTEPLKFIRCGVTR